MRSGGSPDKGSIFERLICRKLSLWISKGKREDLMWRSSMSGGRATIQLRKEIQNMTQSGDISAIGLEGFSLCERFFFECKHYKDLQIGSSLVRDSGFLYQFWSETVESAKSYNKEPMLIARQNRYPILGIVKSDCSIFDSSPIMHLHNWDADLYLFDDAVKTRVRVTLELDANALRRSVVDVLASARSLVLDDENDAPSAPQTTSRRAIL